MGRKPCGGSECENWLAENGVCEPTHSVCYLCGFEGPMCDWYDDEASDDDDESDENDSMEGDDD